MTFLMVALTTLLVSFNYADKIVVEIPKSEIKTTTEQIKPIVEYETRTRWTYDVPLDQELIDYTVEVCMEYGLNPTIVFAIMCIESGYNPNASNGYCFGLMQINECNYGWLNYELGITDLLEPKQNILGGCYILYKLWGGSIESALVCYNTGSYGESSWYSREVLGIASSIEMVEIEYTVKVVTLTNFFDENVR